MKYYLCISPFFPSPNVWQGAYILDQVKAIRRVSNYKIIVLKPTPWYECSNDYEYDGIIVYRFREYTLPSNMWPNRLCDWLTSRSLLRKLKSIGVDINEVAVAHSHVTKQGAYANFLKRLNPKITSIVQHHGFDVMSVTDGILGNNNFHKRQCTKHGVEICNCADLNVGVSRLTLDYVLRNPGIHLKNQYVLYNGVDTSLFYPIPKSEKNEIFTIGCIGNFWPLKDQMTLIKAIELLVEKGFKNICCIFVGTGATLEGCKNYVNEHNLGKRIEFRTEVQHSALPEFYRSLDLFVLPSYWEAFGCVYTEAYACGVPFIGVKGQGIAEIIPEEDADKWLIERGNSVQLSSLIEKLIKDSNEKMTLSIKYEIDKLIIGLLDFIKVIK